jgi:hypothetical protein
VRSICPFCSEHVENVLGMAAELHVLLMTCGQGVQATRSGGDLQAEESDDSFNRRLQVQLTSSDSRPPADVLACTACAGATEEPAHVHVLRRQVALALSVKDRGAGAAAGDSTRSSSAVVTPNSAAAAAFDRALHSRGSSLHMTGPIPGVNDHPTNQW